MRAALPYSLSMTFLEKIIFHNAAPPQPKVEEPVKLVPREQPSVIARSVPRKGQAWGMAAYLARQ